MNEMIDATADIEALLRTQPVDSERVAEMLVREYYSQLRRIAFSILCDPDEADDITLESLLNALHNLQNYRPGSNLKSWLAAITVNRARDQLRRRASRQRLHQALAWLRLEQTSPPSPEETAITNESRRTLWAAVQKLDEKHRLPILLKFVHELPVSEIARILGLPEGTVHSRLHYGIRKLQEELHD